MQNFAEQVSSYFQTIPSSHRTLILFGGLFIFILVENALPFFTNKYNKWYHGANNIFFTFTTIIVNFLMAFILVWASSYVVENNFGLFQWLNTGILATLFIGLLLLDFTSAWLVHWVEHHVKWLWQFHVIHHTDQHIDATSANRHHPGESLVRFAFTTVSVLLFGAPLWLVFMYQSISVILTQFNHSNIKIPTWLDKILVWVICTPNMHRVHHHYRQPYSDTNYGNIFSFWDRIMGTYIQVDNAKLIYGVDTYMDKKEASNIINLLKLPFNGYRDPITYKDTEKL